MRTNIALLVIAAALLSACTSPTAPTPTPSAPAAAVPLYRWDFVAPGCQVATPVPNLTDVAPAWVVELADGTRRAFYAQGPPRANGDQDFIGGDFRRLDKVWAVCAWNRYTRGVNP